MTSVDITESDGYETELQVRKQENCGYKAQLREQGIVQGQVAEGRKNRPMTRPEEATLMGYLENNPSTTHAVVLRRLKLSLQRRSLNLRTEGPGPFPSSLAPLQVPLLLQDLPVASGVLDALGSIATTPFESSFLSRLHGAALSDVPGLVAVDWITKSPWVNLMSDIREHYSYTHPEQGQPVEVLAPIMYTILHTEQLPQVHDLLEKSFWFGINVSDSLFYNPEQCTVVAMYKKVVVGAAILSSPQETYIMYLAVKAGWDNSHIARTMLYHLIARNSYRDITLHVSTNNPAMLLYSLFGFKVEEFVAGFYEEYLDPQSRASKNAFKLRLRQQR